jgi:hypothetical protein
MFTMKQEHERTGPLLGALGAGLLWVGAASCTGQASPGLDASAECPAGDCADETGSRGETDDRERPAMPEPIEPNELGSNATLAFSACNPMSEWQNGERTSVARVESHHRTQAGEQVVIIGPEPSDPNAARVFVGRDGRLKEVTNAVTTSSSAVGKWSFAANGATGPLGSFEIHGVYPEQNERASSNSSSVFVDGVESALEQLPRTRLALAGLEFECARPDALGWRLSNDPERHEPPSACVSPPLPEFHCFQFPAGSVSDFDPAAGVQSAQFRAEVLALGTGRPPGDVCSSEVENRLVYDPNTRLVWARIARAGAEGWLVLRSPGVALPFAAGSSVDISYIRQAATLGATLDVRSTSGKLLLWMGQALELESVVTPAELSVATGPEQCATLPSGCYLSSQYAIDFDMGGQTERLTYGASVTRGG